MKCLTGLDKISQQSALAKNFPGNIGYLAHSASVDHCLDSGVEIMQELFGSRFQALFGPQHGFVTDVQDNMIETRDFIHPYFKKPVHSLYGNTRIPTDQMLSDLNTILVDLQDIGTRIYTYIYTLTYLMEACGKKDIKVVVLDRPNPINGRLLEGNILEPEFASFVGRHPLPVRHGMTMGEIAMMANKEFGCDCDLEVIKMEGWERQMWFDQTSLPWVMPSPNIPTLTSATVFPATVLFEGTLLSEGRGTTRPLEIIGHPSIEPYGLVEKINSILQKTQLTGFQLRPQVFQPTFQKHANLPCGGFQIHVTDREQFEPWKLGQALMKILFHELGPKFEWKQPPYEYENEKLPIDIINGTEKIRHWIEQTDLDMDALDKIEQEGLQKFQELRLKYLLY